MAQLVVWGLLALSVFALIGLGRQAKAIQRWKVAHEVSAFGFPKSDEGRHMARSEALNSVLWVVALLVFFGSGTLTALSLI